MSIVFRNPGVLDPLSIKTFGVSSKEKPGAIGFFGTGLKYAIAILLRHGCRITIHTGGERYTFGTEDARVRVDDFTFVTMNGERLGFTTELGKTWDLWMAFRELYCNAMDENGTVYELDVLDSDDSGIEFNETVITVSGEPFRDVWATRSSYILDTEPLYKHEGVHIHAGASEFAFYRGVRAMKLARPSRFTYNVQRRLELTEDRTVKYTWDVDAAVKRGWLECSSEDLIDHAVLAPQETYEHHLEFSGAMPSPAFMARVGQHMRSRTLGCNRSAIETCRVWMMDKLVEEDDAVLSDLDQRRLEKAVTFCERIGFPVRSYPIKVVDFLGEGVLGQAHEGRILLSTRAFLAGTKIVAGTLVEEFIHLRHNCADGSREMQNILVDTICSLGEHMTGDPL